jgi:hypothetical protein
VLPFLRLYNFNLFSIIMLDSFIFFLSSFISFCKKGGIFSKSSVFTSCSFSKHSGECLREEKAQDGDIYSTEESLTGEGGEDMKTKEGDCGRGEGGDKKTKEGESGGRECGDFDCGN